MEPVFGQIGLGAEHERLGRQWQAASDWECKEAERRVEAGPMVKYLKNPKQIFEACKAELDKMLNPPTERQV